ncbi:MAG: outer membrane protein assembly factor BamA [Alphaproteobacteria bacterium]|nr:outer membrane protein assembly factor BamA [Alphaproteobacteria bacterium]
MRKISLTALSLGLMLSYQVEAAEIYVRDIEVDGLQRVETETVLSYLNINKNSNVSSDYLNASLKRLFETGLFADVNFDRRGDGLLVIKLVENPIINKRVFDGNDKIDDALLESEVQLKSGSIYNIAKVQEDVQRILEVYKRSGRYATAVEPKIIKRDQNRVDLVYEISEGPEAAISKVNFVGNTHYSDDDLQSEIMSKESRWYRLFSSAENYDPEKTNYDKELLRRFYLKRGYADFRVISAIAELSPDKKSFVVTYVLDEGSRYEVENIVINSAIRDVDTAPLYDEILIEKGDWYNADLTEKSVFAITEELGKKGFAFVDVTPDLRKTANGKLDVVFDIDEGQRVFVDRINITGNTRTEDEVIRREFRIDEGDAFNAAKIRASRRNVENLNYFSKVDIQTEPNPEDDSKADINVNVEEKSTGAFNVGVGYSTVNGALFRAGVVENNFQGKGQKLSADVGISQRTSEYDLSFTEPYFMGRRLSAGVDLFRTEEDYQDEGSYDSESTGGRLRLGWNYTDDLAQYVRYTLKEDKISNVDNTASIYIKEEEGKYSNSSIGQTLVYDKRDSAINPKEGYYLSFGNDVAGLGGDEKYLKFDGKAYKYFTLADYYTFKLFFNGGYITGYNHQDVRLSNRYYLGGSTLRGFEFAGIGARDKFTKDALGGNWMIYSGAEMSFPIGLDEVGVRGRTFVDMGMLGKPDNINKDYVDYSDTPRVAAGFGFQWQSPMGQIDVDLAFPIVKEDYDETEVFRLNFGSRL